MKKKLKKFFSNLVFVFAVVLAWIILITVLTKLPLFVRNKNYSQQNDINANYNYDNYSEDTYSNTDYYNDNLSNNNYISDNPNANSIPDTNKNPNDIAFSDSPETLTDKNSIINFYNKIIHNLSGSSVSVLKTQFMTMEITDYPAIMKSMVESQQESMKNIEPLEINKVFSNGKSIDGSTLSEFLPSDKNTVPSLSSLDVKNAYSTKIEDGYKVIIEIVDEETDNMQTFPEHHANCMDSMGKIMKTYVEEYQKENPPSETPETQPPQQPSTNENPSINGSIKMNYYSGTLTLIIDNENNVKSLEVKMPVNMYITMETALFSIKFQCELNLDQTYKFKY